MVGNSPRCTVFIEVERFLFMRKGKNRKGPKSNERQRPETRPESKSSSTGKKGPRNPKKGGKARKRGEGGRRKEGSLGLKKCQKVGKVRPAARAKK